MGHADLPQRPLSKKAASWPFFCCIDAKPESATLISNAPPFGSLEEELTARLDHITANLRRGYEADSKERAKQLEDSEVVDALGYEAAA